ncbi:MAG: hypothetical protein RR923_05925 [Bacilli bacterium]
MNCTIGISVMNNIGIIFLGILVLYLNKHGNNNTLATKHKNSEKNPAQGRVCTGFRIDKQKKKKEIAINGRYDMFVFY